VSYSDDEDTIDPAYAAAVELLFKKLGARGTSMIHASGDGGVSGAQGGACLPGGRLRPTWPASSPYVTSVGATDTSYAAAAGFSAGGFSNRYAPAPYQAAAVAAYLARNVPGMPPAASFNKTGRGVPDVSAVGEGFMIVSSGQNLNVDGTSCSTPTFAGIVGLLNDARVFAGKPPLGFLVRGAAARASPRRPRRVQPRRLCLTAPLSHPSTEPPAVRAPGSVH
jgi:tripeptidyl-peptidase-1